LPSLRGTKQSYFWVSDNKRLLQSFLFRNDLSFYYQEINKLVYRHCEVRSNLINGYSKSKECSIVPLSQWRIVFLLRKKQPKLPSLRGTKQSYFWVFDNKRMFNRSSFAMTYRFSIKKEPTSVSVLARYQAISSMDILNQKIASIVPLSQWPIVLLSRKK
jgi:hypothetical protein